MPKPEFSPMRDLISGTIMAATSIPQLVAYAETVGCAGYRGLTTAGPSLIAWGIITGSPFMNSGVTSITAIMAKADLDGESYVSEFGEVEYVKLISAYSLYVGFASIVLAVIGFGTLAQTVPKPVRSGFKWGCSLGVVVSALPNGIMANGSKQLKAIVSKSILGPHLQQIKLQFPAATGAINVTNILYALTHPQLCWATIPTILFITCTVFVLQAKVYLPKFLPPGTEVIIATVLATIVTMSMKEEYEGGIVGEIPTMDPNAGLSFLGGSIRLPIEVLNPRELLMDVPIIERFGNSWLMLGISSTLFAGVNFLSIMGIASAFETEDQIPWSASRELIAQGIACIVAGWTGSAPVSGSLSRSLVSRMTGTTSPLACIFTALIWIYFMPYMSVLMAPTPKAALSAVVISAVIKGVIHPKDLWKYQGLDSVVGWGTGIVTAITSPTIGFGFGLILVTFCRLLAMLFGSNKQDVVVADVADAVDAKMKRQ